MNIKEAKQQIKNAIIAYFSKDEFGEYIIPIERQRPIFLMGPPGIGKTAIMEQIAQELGVGLISYSMTHHTRQSALGLPFIEEKEYGGKKYNVSEYTMSEIIASVYDMMEATDLKEGILFLDEINCVSETLAPSMLQFLQYKIFGRHKVPDGWIVVTAGNPPEFNNSVREFDIVTWDRLKRIDITPSYDVWKEYATFSMIHPSITTYLDIKKDDFYKIETTVDGKSFVTARGWTDLSDMIKLYEKNGIHVDESLVSQYLQNNMIAKEFAVYYDLFNKYKSDYQINSILSGQTSEEIISRAKAAKFDERLSFIGLLLSTITGELKDICLEEAAVKELMGALKTFKIRLAGEASNPASLITKVSSDIKKLLKNGRLSNSISTDKQYAYNKTIKELGVIRSKLVSDKIEDGDKAFAVIKKHFDELTKDLKKNADDTGKRLENVFIFLENVYSESQEMLIFVTELTMNYYSGHFISKYGCPKYFEHNKELLFYERQKEIIAEIDELEI